MDRHCPSGTSLPEVALVVMVLVLVVLVVVALVQMLVEEWGRSRTWIRMGTSPDPQKDLKIRSPRTIGCII